VRVRKLGLTLLVVCIALGGAFVPAADAAMRAGGGASKPRLAWTRCRGGECGKLTVPLDYAQPKNGKTIKVALFRARATDPKHRIGSLLVNPGGPGAPGIETARQLARSSGLPPELHERFDLIGFDPRGTGGTTPVKCEDNLDSIFALDYSPDTPEERAKLDDAVQRLAKDCQQRNADLLPFISTQNTARDMDRIRIALGEKKLNYLGFSYGTYLGALYASFFPHKVRVMVLDGAVDPELSALDVGIQQAVGFEKGLNAFLDNCSRHRSCSLYNGGDAGAAFDALAAQVDQHPVPARDRTLGPGEFTLGVAQALYGGEQGWPQLDDALGAASRGDGEPLLALTDEYTGRHDDGTYDNLQDAYWSIGCLDGPALGGPDAYQAVEAQFRAQAPRVGVPILNNGLVCAYWQVRPVQSPGPLHAAAAPPILVIGTTGDPATPLQWAQSLAKQLDSGVLLVAEGKQHTAFLSGNPCVDGAVVTYLVAAKPPQNGKHCT
jgi:pimeloyl-ACP methyl ester carboxylesterase